MGAGGRGWGVGVEAGVRLVRLRRCLCSHTPHPTPHPPEKKMKRLITIALLCAALPLHADDKAAAVLARSDVFRNPIESFSVDVELTSIATSGKTDTSRFRVYGKSSDRSVVEFTF